MFVYHRAADRIEHRLVRDLPEYLAPNDLLVLNDTRVLPHRLLGRRASGGKVEILILNRTGDECRGYVRPARKIRLNESIPLEDGRLLMHPLEDLGKGQFRFRLEAPLDPTIRDALEAVGRAPLPPYIRRSGDEDRHADRARYQTVFAKQDGAVAAPTAGLHFTPDLLGRVAARGVDTAWVTLHVGEGTFSSVRVDAVEDHQMHAEDYELSTATAVQIEGTREQKGRVVAVGTTAARTLETCASEGGLVSPGSGATQLFLYPGRKLQVVDVMLTNFHLPESTLLMLIAAFVGHEKVLELYQEAVTQEYRFYSFGDAMLLL